MATAHVEPGAAPGPTPAPSPPATPPAWPGVAAVAVAVSAALLLLADRYGYHRDELYFRMLADAPAWGYVDQPPATPLLARAAIEVFGDSLWALRVPAALLAGALAVLLALLAREVGGDVRAQIVAALGAASATPLISGHVLLTASLDWPLTVLVGLLAVRALVRGGRRWWVLAGVVAGLALLNKLLIALLLLGLVVGLAVSGPRRALLSTGPWLGAVAAAAVGAPTIAYQLTHGIPQAQMVGSLTGDAARLLLVPGQALALGPPAVLVWGAGLLALLRSPAWRRLRALGVAYPVMCAVLLVLGGQFYYSTGILLILYAIGAVVVVRWVDRRPSDRALVHLRRGLAINVAASAVIALPVLPADVLGRTPVPLLNPAAGDQIGWQAHAGVVAAAARRLPPGEGGVVIADNYGEAGAVDRYGPALGAPPVVSGHNGLYELGGPPPGTQAAVVVMQGDGAADFLAGVFERCEEVGVLDNGIGVPNEEQGTPVRVCTGPRGTWQELWPRLRHVGLSTFCEPCRRLNLTE